MRKQIQDDHIPMNDEPKSTSQLLFLNMMVNRGAATFVTKFIQLMQNQHNEIQAWDAFLMSRLLKASQPDRQRHGPGQRRRHLWQRRAKRACRGGAAHLAH
jgi:hypothetical protein